MRIAFLGGADEVGASCVLLEWAGKRILIDAGVRPSSRARSGIDTDTLPDLSLIDAGTLDAVLVTHAHADHAGALELVVGRYPDIPIYATPLTIALIRVLHADARRIMQTRADEEAELPLYDDVATELLLNSCKPVPFNTEIPLGNGLTARFFHAGHIAGAAMIGLESSNLADGGRLLISGDISVSPQRTVDGVKPPNFKPDVLILESTYGGRLHANRAVEEERLIATISRVLEEDGKVLIPAFALGRAQELLLTLDAFQRKRQLPAVPVWADGMVRAVCGVYGAHLDALPLAFQERGGRFFNALTKPIERPDQRHALVQSASAAVIVASSGMLMGGPSLFYARAFARERRNAILLTGYQDEESPGKRLQEMASTGRTGALQLGAERVDAQCQLGVYSLSAHADEAQLLSLTEYLDPPHIFLVHGDGSARESLRRAIAARKRIAHLPRAGQSFTFDLPPVPARRSDGHLTADNAAWERAQAQLAQHHVSQPDVVQPTEPAGPMEPNAAMALARALLPGEAHLRKCGYDLRTTTLKIAFDFPDIAQVRFADVLSTLAEKTRWRIDIDPARNPNAFSALAREIVGVDWRFLTVPRVDHGGGFVEIEIGGGTSDTSKVHARFREACGFDLYLAKKSAPVPAPQPLARAVQPLEINAAYAMIKSVLAGSTLYRTSLKGGVIVLSFISPQVGARFTEQIDQLEAQTGYRLDISDAPNQLDILNAARALLAQAGAVVVKGPSIFVDRAAVGVSLRDSLDLAAADVARNQFLLQTGYTLELQQPASHAAPVSTAIDDAVQIAIARIRLSRALAEVQLDEDKLQRAVERVRRIGVQPPVKVRRQRDGYLLIDGKYRLEAALRAGMTHVPAVVE